MKASYQKSAQRKGFSAQQVSRQNVQNILNKGKQDQKYIEQAAEAEIRESERQEKARKTQFDITADEEKRDFDIDLTNIQEREKARAESERVNIEAQQAMFGSIAKLSANAAKIYQDYDKKREEEQIKSDYFEYQTNPEYRKGVQDRARAFRNQQALATSDTNTSISASDAAGVNKVEIGKISNATSGLTVGQQLGYVNEQSRNYSGWMAEQLASPDPILTIDGQSYTGVQVAADPTLFNQFSSDGVYRFMQETGMAGMSMEALSPALDNINTVNNRLSQQVARQFDTQARDRRWNEWKGLAGNLTRLSPNASQQEVNDLLEPLLAETSILSYATNGQPSKGTDFIFELLKKKGPDNRPLIPKGSKLYNTILKVPVGPSGETIGSYEGRVLDLEANQLQAERQADDRARVDERNAVFDTLDAALPDLLEQLEANKDDPGKVDDILDTLENELQQEFGAFGLGNSQVNALRRQYGGAKATKLEKERIEAQAREGTLDREEILENVDDPANRQEALKLYEQQETNKYGPNYKNTIEAIPGWAAEVSGGALVTGPDGVKIKNPYQSYIEQDMKREFKAQFQSSFKKYMAQGKAEGEAQALAATDARSWIDTQRKEAEANNPKARYYQLPTPGGSQVKTYPNLNITGPLTKPIKDVKSNVRLLKGKALSTYGAILTTAQMRDLAQRYNAMNGSYSVPQSVELVRQSLAAAGEKYSAKDIINEQIRAYNKYQNGLPAEDRLPVIDELVTVPAEQELNQADEETIRIFNDARAISPVRARRATAGLPGGEEVLRTSNRFPEMRTVNAIELPQELTGNAKARTIQLGRSLESFGYRAWQHPDFSVDRGYTGSGNERVGAHTSNSAHYHNEALDFPLSHNSNEQLNQLYDFLTANKEALGIGLVLWQTKGHYTHLHVDLDHRVNF